MPLNKFRFKLVILLAAVLPIGCTAPSPPPPVSVIPSYVELQIAERTQDTAQAVEPTMKEVIPRPQMNDPVEKLAPGYSEEDQRQFQAQARYMMAVYYLNNERFEEAVLELQTCIQLNPENPLYPERLGLHLIQSSSTFSQGIKRLQQAVESGSMNQQVWYRLGNIYKDKDDREQATYYFEGFVRLNPPLADIAAQADFSWNASFASSGYRNRVKFAMLRSVLENLAQYYRSSDSKDDYQRILVQLSDPSVKDDTYRIQLAALYIEDAQFQEALQSLNAIKNIYDLDEEGFIGTIQLYRLLVLVPGFFPDATRQGIINKITDYIDTYISIKGAAGRVLLTGVDLASSFNDFERAADLTLKVATSGVNQELPVQAIAYMAYRGGVQEAIDILEKLELKRGLTSDLEISRGQLLILNGDQEAGAALIDKKLSHLDAQERAMYYFRAARFFIETGSYEAAAAFSRIASELSPENNLYRLSHVEALYLNGHIDDSLNMLEELLAAEQNAALKADIQNMLGYLLALEQKTLKRARELIKKALASAPQNPAYLDSMGWVLYMAGLPKEAGPYLIKAADLNPEYDILHHLGDYYNSQGDGEQAYRSWVRAYLLKQDPELLNKILEIKLKK